MGRNKLIASRPMLRAPPTHHTLLLRLRDSRDEEAWRQFVELYAPAVFRTCRRRGLQEADAADVTQEVLRSIAAGPALRRAAR